jgi:hypothetical protein
VRYAVLFDTLATSRGVRELIAAVESAAAA